MRSLALLLALPACDPTLTPDPPSAADVDALAFSVANNHTVIATNMFVVSRGSDVPGATNENGESVPVNLPGMIDVAVGLAHACAVSVTGVVECWGDQTRYALGLGRACPPPTADGAVPACVLGPAAVPGLPPVRSIVAGDDVSCALTPDAEVMCWGAPERTGGSYIAALATPVPVTLDDGTPLLALRLVANRGTMCAIDQDAALWCWGDRFGARPQRQANRGVVDVAFGAHHSCIIDADGLACWGDDRNGQVGDLAFARACGDGPCSISEPFHVDVDAQRVVVGERHTCALTTANEVVCWGSNEVGQLGRDDAFLVGGIGPAFDGATDLAAGYAHTCAQRGQEVWCWGSTLEQDPAEVQP